MARKNEESLKVNRDIIDITKMGVQLLLTTKGGGVALALLAPSPHFVNEFRIFCLVIDNTIHKSYINTIKRELAANACDEV